MSGSDGVRRSWSGEWHLVILRGILDPDVEEETIELRLGKRISPFLLDRVLGREHEEGLGEPHGLAGGGHAVLLHGLEEGGLGPRGSAVDLVGQDDVGEDRPGEEPEFPGTGIRIFLHDLGPGYITGDQIRA